MAITSQTELVDAAGLTELRTPRDDIVLEREAGADRFELEEGPFHRYERSLDVVELGDDEFEVTQTTEFKLAIPVWGWLFVRPVKRSLHKRLGKGEWPWWSPPDRMSERSSNVLGLLCGLSIVVGYLGTLLSQTITFAADEFGATDTQQGDALAAVRIGVLLALVLTSLADRRGRRRMLLFVLYAGIVLTATTALAPNLFGYAASQTVARAMSTTAILLLPIIAVEEMPASSRAYAISVMTMSGALGGGMVLWLLPLADIGPSAWRVLFVAPLLLIFLVRGIGRHLPESKRFERAEETDLDDIASHKPEARRTHRRRLVLLAASALVGSLFFTPASQFFNDFLRDDRGFSAARISLFVIMTNVPGGIGIVVGGKLADVRGRRIVGAIGLIGGVGATVIMYNVFGPAMWMWSVVGAVLGAATVPALAVYGPELFPTNMRGKANAVIAVFGVIGGVTGLAIAGRLSDRWDGFGPVMTLLAIGPVILVLLVILFYPETAHRELEDINPEDEVLMHPGGATGPGLM